MEVYTYIVARDFGFAPNPFGRYCTLCTCKPKIRKNALVGDWVIGTGAVGRYGLKGQLIYAMRIDEKITFNEYWEDPRFQYKKPIFNGSLKQCFGDNIYFQKESGEWVQKHSHHSYEDGSTNTYNLNRDTKWDFVLISERFYYFGTKNVEIPAHLKADACKDRQGEKRIPVEPANELIDWIETNFQPGMIGIPLEFENGFKHYDGIS